VLSVLCLQSIPYNNVPLSILLPILQTLLLHILLQLVLLSLVVALVSLSVVLPSILLLESVVGMGLLEILLQKMVSCCTILRLCNNVHVGLVAEIRAKNN